MVKRQIFFLLLVAVLSFPQLILAETLLLKSGQQIEGKIVERTDKYVKVYFMGVLLTYFYDQIEAIDGAEPVIPIKEAEVVPSDATQTDEATEKDRWGVREKVAFDFGVEHLVAELEPECKIAWLINGGNAYGKKRYMFFVFSMDQVNMLNRKYGGYRNWATCNSEGAQEGQSSLSTVVLITRESTLDNKLAQILTMVFKSPIVEITGSKLNIVEYTYNKIKAVFSTPMTYYLISDIEIMQNSYP